MSVTPFSLDGTYRLLGEAAGHDLERLAEDVARLDQSLHAAQRRVALLESSLEAERTARVSADHAVVARLRPMIAGMRLDRQVRRAGSRAAAMGHRAGEMVATLTHPRPPTIVIVCPHYPGGPRPYGGEFVRARVRRYADQGLGAEVVVTDQPAGSAHTSTMDGVVVHRTHRGEVAALLERLAPSVIGVHHMEPELWQELRRFAGAVPMIVWVHGFEARDWRELAVNYDADELERIRGQLEGATAARRMAMAEVFSHTGIHVVFVSRFMRDVAERFAGRRAAAASVIPNPVDETVFRYRVRAAEDRRKVLWVRSFAARNYANDLARDALVHLTGTPHFENLTITVVGDGRYFEECTEPLRGMPNVSIQRGFVDTDRLVELHRQHGLMLVPSRWDSQGLTCLEAMSSGLVPITSDVAAVPEFVPPDAGILCPPEDPVALAEAIIGLQDDAEDFLRRSRAAAQAARRVCGVDRTVAVECALITRTASIRPAQRLRAELARRSLARRTS